MELLNLVLLTIIFCVALLIFSEIRKLRVGDKKIRKQLEQLYIEVQAYLELARLIRPTKPLPMLRGWAASPDFLLHIAQYAIRHKPTTIVECSSGASTLVLARCCQLNGQGHVYSMENAREFAQQSRTYIADHQLDEWATVIDAPLEQTQIRGEAYLWYATGGLSTVPDTCDLLVVDGPVEKTSPLARYPALPVLLRRLSPNCVVFLDDANRPSEQRVLSRWKEEYPDFEQLPLPTEKGCVMLIRKPGKEKI